MPAQNGVVGKHNTATDLTIVTNMRTHHQKTAVANLGDSAIVFSACVHGDVFANITVLADNKTCRSAAIAVRLGRGAERCKRTNDGSGTYACMTSKIHMREQPAAVTDPDICADRAIWTDPNVFTDFCPGFDPRRGIDHTRAHSLDSRAPTCASATTWPATLASPRYHHIDLRRVMRSM